MYKVEWKEEALESLAKIGQLGDKIKVRVENHLAKNPTKFGKFLKGNLKGLWKYRCFADYRVIYQLLQAKIIITVVEVGRRGDIYQKLGRKYNY